jgi:hypothetical protein
MAIQARAQDAQPAAAAVTTRTVVVKGPIEVASTSSDLDALDAAFTGGNVAHARELATAIVKQAHDHPTVNDDSAGRAFDPALSRLIVIWPAVDVDDTITLRRLALPADANDAYTLDLPGIGMQDSLPGLYEVFIAGDKRSSLISVYTSTRSENPLLAQIVDVAGRVITPLFGVVSGVAGEVARAHARALTVAPPSTLFVTSSRIILPWKRSTVSVKSQAQIPATSERVKHGVDLLVANLVLNELGRSQWARLYAYRMADQTAATAAACVSSALTPEACLRRFDTDFTNVFTDCVTHTSCMPGTPSDEDKTAFKKVDDTVRTFVGGGIVSTVKTDSAFANTPLTHFGFGLTTGLLVTGSSSKVRVKLDDDGNVVADPLGRQISMIVVNWSPAGYRPSDPSPTWRERARLFFGAVITPDFGVGGGASVLIVRGLAVNVGAGLLLSRGAASADALGKPPDDAKKPFELSRTPFTFVGASFTFK